MILFPAIDLKQGQCVRLSQGDMNAATLFNPDPADQARRFAQAGAEWLHLVDLDGAIAGKPVNGGAVEAILAAGNLPCQLGGGIRDLGAIEAWLVKGVARVILGTAALKNPALVREAASIYPGRIAVAIDARGGKVAVEGWVETSEIAAIELARRFEDAGVAAIIFTDIDRDGMMRGLNAEASSDLARRISIPVIASGGLASIEDLDRLLALAPGAGVKGGGLAGVIAGRAIYDGRLDLGAAIRHLKRAGAC